MCLAVPGKIIEILKEDPTGRTARVDFGGVSRNINLSYVPEAKIGDYVMVHVGFAISLLDEDLAQETLVYLTQLDDWMEKETQKA